MLLPLRVHLVMKRKIQRGYLRDIFIIILEKRYLDHLEGVIISRNYRRMHHYILC